VATQVHHVNAADSAGLKRGKRVAA
jgi:hypothetical protein